MSGELERRYRRVLRVLPRYYREQWEQDMIGAFLDGWLTGDPEADEYISKAARPSWAEVASVAGLAARLYLRGQGTPRRMAWPQAKYRRGAPAPPRYSRAARPATLATSGQVGLQNSRMHPSSYGSPVSQLSRNAATMSSSHLSR